MNLTYKEKDKNLYIKENHWQIYSLKKPIYFKTYSKNDERLLEPYPIKPFHNIIPKDINLQKIFTIQKTSSQIINKRFSSLFNNNINNTNNNHRIKILNKVKEFILKYHLDYKIYYKMIILYDILLIDNESKKLLSNEDIALGALVLSVKFNYIENKMISMKKFLNLYDNKIYTLEKLIRIERACLYMSKYYLNYNTPMCFLEFFLINGIIFNTDSITKENYTKLYHKVENVLEKLMEESNNYLKYNFFHLSCSIVSYVRKLFELKKWPLPLKKIFGIDYINFEKEYNSIFTKDDKNNNNIDNKREIVIKGNNNTILLNFQDKENENLSKSLSNFNLYQNTSENINNNKYCNNIINININNYSIDNNNINSYLYKKGFKLGKSFNGFSLKKNKLKYKFNSKLVQISESNDTSQDKKYDTKIKNNNLIINNEKSFRIMNENKSKTTYCSHEKNKIYKTYKKNQDIYKEKDNDNDFIELKDEFNKTAGAKKNYNFASRFKLKNYPSTGNLNSFFIEQNKDNSQKTKILELKNTLDKYNKIKVRLKNSDENPKKPSLLLTFKKAKQLKAKNYTERKMLPIKSEINNNDFETPSKNKRINEFNFKSNEKDKKENKVKNKIRYNNLIKYKLSISSSSYKTKNF